MRRLVPLDATGGPGFVDALRRIWDDGDAALPVDPRLPVEARRALVAAMEPDRPVEDGDALVVPTSGSTGTPKGVVLTHAAVEASARATSARLGVDPDRDRWLACLPLAHVGGLSVVTRALVTATPVTVVPGFDVGAVDEASGDHTLVSLVHTALGRLTRSDRWRWIVLGGAAPPPDRPANTVATYGMTETGSGVVYDGRPLDGVELAVRPGPAGAAEIHVRGPMLLRAYRDGRVPLDGHGWFPTGDLGSLDPATGVLTVQGRGSELIISGGENVWPAPVERALVTVAGVADAAVVGRPHPEWGQQVTAVVVPTDASALPTLEDLRAALRDQLPPWALPKAVEHRTSIPRTALGKVRRSEL